MTKQEKQALAKIALKNKNTKEGKELSKIIAQDEGPTSEQEAAFKYWESTIHKNMLNLRTSLNNGLKLAEKSVLDKKALKQLKTEISRSLNHFENDFDNIMQIIGEY